MVPQGEREGPQGESHWTMEGHLLVHQKEWCTQIHLVVQVGTVGYSTPKKRPERVTRTRFFTLELKMFPSFRFKGIVAGHMHQSGGKNKSKKLTKEEEGALAGRLGEYMGQGGLFPHKK